MKMTISIKFLMSLNKNSLKNHDRSSEKGREAESQVHN